MPGDYSCAGCGARFDEVARLRMHEAAEHKDPPEDEAARREQGLTDPTDEAAADSFPSSDPPAQSTPAAGREEAV